MRIARLQVGIPRRHTVGGREIFTDRFRAETMVRRIAEVYEEELARAAGRD